MIEAQLNVFDMIVISIMLLSCVFAFFRGFVREILSLCAWLGAGMLTIACYKNVAHLIEPYFKKPEMATVAASVGLYLAVLIAFAIFNSYIIKILKSGDSLGVMDNMLGLAFGGLRAGFIISLGYFLILLSIGEHNPPQWLEKAQTRPYVESGAKLLESLAPEHLHKISDFQKKAASNMQENADEEDKEEPLRDGETKKEKKPLKLDKIFYEMRKENKDQK